MFWKRRHLKGSIWCSKKATMVLSEISRLIANTTPCHYILWPPVNISPFQISLSSKMSAAFLDIAHAHPRNMLFFMQSYLKVMGFSCGFQPCPLCTEISPDSQYLLITLCAVDGEIPVILAYCCCSKTGGLFAHKGLCLFWKPISYPIMITSPLLKCLNN